MNDVFEIEAAIGNLKHIYIGHDNTGLGANWHLQASWPRGWAIAGGDLACRL